MARRGRFSREKRDIGEMMLRCAISVVCGPSAQAMRLSVCRSFN